jgi:hypothetical protein
MNAFKPLILKVWFDTTPDEVQAALKAAGIKCLEIWDTLDPDDAHVNAAVSDARENRPNALNAMRGAWPGDENYEELMGDLAEMRGKPRDHYLPTESEQFQESARKTAEMSGINHVIGDESYEELMGDLVKMRGKPLAKLLDTIDKAICGANKLHSHHKGKFNLFELNAFTKALLDLTRNAKLGICNCEESLKNISDAKSLLMPCRMPVNNLTEIHNMALHELLNDIEEMILAINQ